MEYKIQRQLTAALENVPGRLAEICEIMNQHEINIEGICVVDNVEQGVVRLITDRPADAKALMVEQRIYVVEADVIIVELTDQRGMLGKISAALATHNINIDYLYGSTLQTGSRTKIVLKLSDMGNAQRILHDLDVN
ncbi:ACT domain-containing protein [bacterium]|nr:MAG: ACT domain-containing protein [bacterium]